METNRVTGVMGFKITHHNRVAVLLKGGAIFESMPAAEVWLNQNKDNFLDRDQVFLVDLGHLTVSKYIAETKTVLTYIDSSTT